MTPEEFDPLYHFLMRGNPVIRSNIAQYRARLFSWTEKSGLFIKGSGRRHRIKWQNALFISDTQRCGAGEAFPFRVNFRHELEHLFSATGLSEIFIVEAISEVLFDNLRELPTKPICVFPSMRYPEIGFMNETDAVLGSATIDEIHDLKRIVQRA